MSAAVAVVLAVTTADLGGDGWESNPPRTPQQRPADGFEDRGEHQLPYIPRPILGAVRELSDAQPTCVRPSRFPSGSLNQAVQTFGPTWLIPSTDVTPGTSTFSNSIPAAFRAATSAFISMTVQLIWVWPDARNRLG